MVYKFFDKKSANKKTGINSNSENANTQKFLKYAKLLKYASRLLGNLINRKYIFPLKTTFGMQI